MQTALTPFAKSPSAATQRAKPSTAPAKKRQPCVIARCWGGTIRQNASILIASALMVGVAAFALHDQPSDPSVPAAFATR